MAYTVIESKLLDAFTVIHHINLLYRCDGVASITHTHTHTLKSVSSSGIIISLDCCYLTF